MIVMERAIYGTNAFIPNVSYQFPGTRLNYGYSENPSSSEWAGKGRSSSDSSPVDSTSKHHRARRQGRRSMDLDRTGDYEDDVSRKLSRGFPRIPISDDPYYQDAPPPRDRRHGREENNMDFSPSKKRRNKVKPDVPTTKEEEPSPAPLYRPRAATQGQLNVQLVETTSAHGLPAIARSKCIEKRIFWTFITLAAVAFWIYHTQSLVREYLNYEVSVNLDIKRSPSILFPAVTICNQNPMLVSKAKDIAALTDILNTGGNPEGTGMFYEENNYYYDYDDYYDVDLDSIDGISSEYTNAYKREVLFVEYTAGLSIDERKALGHQEDELVLECVYNGHYCNNITMRYINNWHYGNCFIFNSGNDSSKLIRASQTGPLAGLKLTMNIEQYKYLGFTEKAGVRVLVHSPTEMPFPEDNGFDVQPGVSTSLAISLVNISRLSGKFGDCVNTQKDNSNMNVFEETFDWTTYSMTGCQKTCYQKNLIKTCMCYDSRYPWRGAAFSKTSDLVTQQEFCSVQNKTQVSCKAKINAKFLANDLDCLERCYAPCNQSDFRVTISQAYWPSDTSIDGLADELVGESETATAILEAGRTNISKNLLQMEIYYKELNFESITESEAYSFGQFMSDLGGAMGLYIGASLITLFEYAEFGADSCFLRCCSGGRPREDEEEKRRREMAKMREMEQQRRSMQSEDVMTGSPYYNGTPQNERFMKPQRY